jgi:membrane protein required for colicin V production
VHDNGLKFVATLIWIDFSLIGLLSIMILAGLLRGFNLSLYAFINWLLAIAVGLAFSRECAFFLKLTLAHPHAKMATAFAILVALTLVLGGLIRHLLGDIINPRRLTLTNRLGGMVIGIAHTLMIVTVVVMLAGLSVLPQSPWWKESTLLPPFQISALWLRDHVPSELTQRIRYQ